MTNETKTTLKDSFNTFCYGVVISVCCLVIAFTPALLSFAAIARVI